MQRLRTTFTLSDAVVNELNSVAKELNEKKSHIVEKALNVYFDLLDEQIADKRLDDLKNGKEKLILADEVFKELGI
jgi:predicted transcriptional regulator